MKIRPLPETDLACIAPLPTDRKRQALEGFRLGIPPYSYRPVRTSISDILNLDAGMLGALPRVPFAKVAELIDRKSKSDAESEANRRVAAGLYSYATENQLRGRRDDLQPMPMRVGEKVTYWTPAVLFVNGGPLVAFFNPRRSQLSPLGRRFVFSMMHERVRAENPDYRDVRLGIYHFAPTKTGPRAPELHIDEVADLFSFDELDRMVTETYEIWREICEGRAEETRRRAADGTGSLI